MNVCMSTGKSRSEARKETAKLLGEYLSTQLSHILLKKWARKCYGTLVTVQVFEFVELLFYVHGKHLRSCRDGQLT